MPVYLEVEDDLATAAGFYLEVEPVWHQPIGFLPAGGACPMQQLEIFQHTVEDKPGLAAAESFLSGGGAWSGSS